MKAIIVGGGIGGRTTALMLRARFAEAASGDHIKVLLRASA